MKIPKYYPMGYETFFASIYYFLFNILTFFYIKSLRKKAIGMLRLRKGLSVLDLGCRTGEMTIMSAKVVGERGKVLGIDLSRKMLNIAVKKSKSYSGIKYLRKNFENISYNKIFDVVIISFGVHEIPFKSRYNVYRQVKKVLKSNGKLLIFDYASSKRVFLEFMYKFYLKIIERPYGLEYINENHQEILKKIWFNLIKKQRIAYFFESAVYKKF
jgi:ubiquinone/menaquinone biosynthesis C-methylase UbiE